FATDVCVPISRLAECVVETQRDIMQSGLIAPILGHVGDGNFHLTLLVDLAAADEVARAQALNERLVARALAMDGTSTGEHGVGQGKMAYLAAEHGEPALATMRAIKRALDPDGIMNPGKIVPAVLWAVRCERGAAERRAGSETNPCAMAHQCKNRPGIMSLLVSQCFPARCAGPAARCRLRDARG